MILVDVVFPELDRTIDFQLDERARTWEITEEIASMAAQYSGWSFAAEQSNLMLYKMETGCRLDPNRSLQSNGVMSGDQLLLI